MEEREIRRVCGLLGLAAKAGRVQSGEFCTEKSIKEGRAKLCIVAKDASPQTRKRYADMCGFRGIPLFTETADKEVLGHAIGKEMRAALTVEDAGFAEAIRPLIEGGNADGK